MRKKSQTEDHGALNMPEREKRTACLADNRTSLKKGTRAFRENVKFQKEQFPKADCHLIVFSQPRERLLKTVSGATRDA